jgi:hypothetical protein
MGSRDGIITDWKLSCGLVGIGYTGPGNCDHIVFGDAGYQAELNDAFLRYRSHGISYRVHINHLIHA